MKLDELPIAWKVVILGTVIPAVTYGGIRLWIYFVRLAAGTCE